MNKEKEPALTHEQASIEFYGGVHGLSKMSTPFTCKSCGGKTYPGVNSKGELVGIPVLHVEDIYKHIRKVHRVRIKKVKGEKV